MNILSLLKKDHTQIKSLIAKLEKTTTRAIKTRTRLLKELKENLVLHEYIEETIFYPVLKAKKKTHKLTLEAYEEHHVANMILKEIEACDLQSDTWLAKLIVLKENIAHHIKEEEKKLFPLAKQVLSKIELATMGAEMQQIQIKAHTKSKATIKPLVNYKEHKPRHAHSHLHARHY